MDFDDPFYSFEAGQSPAINAIEDPEIMLDSPDVSLESATDVIAVIMNGNPVYLNVPGQKALL